MHAAFSDRALRSHCGATSTALPLAARSRQVVGQPESHYQLTRTIPEVPTSPGRWSAWPRTLQRRYEGTGPGHRATRQMPRAVLRVPLSSSTTPLLRRRAACATFASGGCCGTILDGSGPTVSSDLDTQADRTVLLRAFCTFHGQRIALLFAGCSKGKDPSAKAAGALSPWRQMAPRPRRCASWLGPIAWSCRGREASRSSVALHPDGLATVGVLLCELDVRNPWRTAPF